MERICLTIKAFFLEPITLKIPVPFLALDYVLIIIVRRKVMLTTLNTGVLTTQPLIIKVTIFLYSHEIYMQGFQ